MSTSGFSFPVGSSAAPTTTVQSTTSSQSSSFGGFSKGFSSAPSGFNLTPTLSATTSSTPTLNFNLNSSSAPSVPSTTTTAGQLTFGSKSLPTSTAAKSTGLSFGTPSSTTTISTAKSSVSTAPIAVTSVSGSTSLSSISKDSDKAINYVQLQDLTVKWMADFEDLQKTLINQTAEMINRDIVLSSNEDKIEKLVDSVKNLKTEQTQVEQQLDFILSQQKDLDECLASLEDEVSSYFPDIPADDMYKQAENIDSRLKKTLETSKEIITKINDKNRSLENITNPMVAIGHILNHLTNSIQMLENLNNEGQTKLNDLQKLYQQYV